jgi:predicted RNase H-like nuclease (RuvC/YqgF family)
VEITRYLLKISKEYEKDDIVKGLKDIIKSLQLENGQLKSYIAELEDTNNKLREDEYVKFWRDKYLVEKLKNND